VMDSGKASLMDFKWTLMASFVLNWHVDIYGLKLRGGQMHHITNYYKSLFGPPEENSVTMDEARIDDIPQVTQQENEFLVATFTEKEVKEAIFQMEHNKNFIMDPYLYICKDTHLVTEIAQKIHYHQFCLILAKLANQISGATDSETQYWKTVEERIEKNLTISKRSTTKNRVDKMEHYLLRINNDTVASSIILDSILFMHLCHVDYFFMPCCFMTLTLFFMRLCHSNVASLTQAEFSGATGRRQAAKLKAGEDALRQEETFLFITTWSATDALLHYTFNDRSIKALFKKIFNLVPVEKEFLPNIQPKTCNITKKAIMKFFVLVHAKAFGIITKTLLIAIKTLLLWHLKSSNNNNKMILAIQFLDDSGCEYSVGPSTLFMLSLISLVELAFWVMPTLCAHMLRRIKKWHRFAYLRKMDRYCEFDWRHILDSSFSPKNPLANAFPCLYTIISELNIFSISTQTTQT
ncbi:hypothetical protein ACJX0J_013658, partial [Zea mays]